VAHSTELKLEHLAGVPAQAVQVHAASVHAILVVFTSQALGVPVQEVPLQEQPGTLTQVWVVTRLAHAAGVPVHAGVHAQPESPQAVIVASVLHASGVPVQLVVKTQPAILPHAVASAAVLHAFGVPAQLSVA
jgi:hypothetical protein